MGSVIWTVRLSAAADADYEQILHWTVDNFGPEQARVYAATLSSALKELCAGPSIVGVKRRSEIGTDICTLHVARKGRKVRHFVMFRVSNFHGQKVIDVLRLLHDSMDLKRHLPSDDPEELSSFQRRQQKECIVGLGGQWVDRHATTVIKRDRICLRNGSTSSKIGRRRQELLHGSLGYRKWQTREKNESYFSA